MDMNQQKITNIVICYANEDEVIDYAVEISKQTIKDRLELLIVVNKEGKGQRYLHEKLSEIEIDSLVVDPKNNMGYLNGLIFGYRMSTNRGPWYVLSNTDIKIPNESFFQDFVCSNGYIDQETWVIGPSVYAPLTGYYSNPYMRNRPSRSSYRTKNFLMGFAQFYNTLFLLKKRFKRNRQQDKKQNSEKVYAVHGSFMFVREELLKELTLRPAWELLYGEEQYLAEMALLSGKSVYFDSSLSVLHMEGTSTGKENVKLRFSRMIKANKRIIADFYE